MDHHSLPGPRLHVKMNKCCIPLKRHASNEMVLMVAFAQVVFPMCGSTASPVAIADHSRVLKGLDLHVDWFSGMEKNRHKQE